MDSVKQFSFKDTVVGLTGPIGVHVKQVVAQPSKLENGTVAIQYQFMVEIVLVQRKILRNVIYLHVTVSLILAIHCDRIKSYRIQGFSGSYFCVSGRMRQNMDQKISKYGQFSCSECS